MEREPVLELLAWTQILVIVAALLFAWGLTNERGRLLAGQPDKRVITYDAKQAGVSFDKANDNSDTAII